MANESFNIDDFNELEAKYQRLIELQTRATDGLKGYNSIIKDIREVAKNLQHIRQQEAKLLAEIEDREKKKKELLAKSGKLQGKNKTLVEAELRALEKEIAARKEGLKYAKQKTAVLQENAAILSESANSSNLISASFVTIGRSAIGLFKSAKDISKELVKEMKAVQLTEQSMGILSKQSDAFRMNLYRAAGTTQQLGVSAADLAKMQGSYSEQIGRSVILSQQGLEAMAEMSKGTMLGADGAAEMAANMDSFGISAIGTKNIIEEMMNLSTKMGVNSVAVTNNLKKNMQLANRFHFKDGVKGMVKLAAAAAKMHLDMEGIASMADKVFRPEGAVEMAARLQTMGGEFAKLGDPFQLMFKARNDFEAFAKDIGEATKEFSKFNEETGQFEISGLGFDRIKEIADITGISADKLAEMSRETAKIQQIEMNVGMGITDDENIEFISSIATFNDITKQWEANVDGQNKNIKTLTDADIKKMKDEKASLKERAKQAQTFDETWKNLQNTFKTLLFPILNGLSEGLKEPMNDFMEWAQKSGGFDKLFESAKTIGTTIGKALKGITKVATTIAEFVADNPITSLISVIGGMGLFKYLQWVANGKALAVGFNMGASIGGGMGGPGGGGRRGMFGRGGMGNMLGMGNPFSGAKNGFRGAGIQGKGIGGKMWGGLKGGMGGMGNMGLGLLGMAGGMGMDYLRMGMDDPDSAGGKALGIGSSALQGAGMGAMFGPWGALIGGLLGGGYGAYKELNFEDKNKQISNIDSYDDVIMRSGQAPIGISPADDVMAVKKDGPVDKALGGATKGGGTSNISFSPLTINGKIELVGDGASGSIDLSDPILMRNLSKVITEEIRKAIGGGKLNPNPAK